MHWKVLVLGKDHMDDLCWYKIFQKELNVSNFIFYMDVCWLSICCVFAPNLLFLPALLKWIWPFKYFFFASRQWFCVSGEHSWAMTPGRKDFRFLALVDSLGNSMRGSSSTCFVKAYRSNRAWVPQCFAPHSPSGQQSMPAAWFG